MAKFFYKIIPFVAIFSAVFYLFRTSDYYTAKILSASLGGAATLYGTIGSMYGLIAAFVINRQWEQWNNLEDAVKSEVDALERFWLWFSNFPKETRDRVQMRVKRYLELMINEGLQLSADGIRSQAIEDALNSLHKTVYHMFKEDQSLMSPSFGLFADILKCRSDRLRYSSHKVPRVLVGTLVFGVFLMVGLSFFVVIKNIFFDYIFTIGIGTLAYMIYLVVGDLNNPLRPGDWHITTRDYKDLLKRIEAAETIQHMESK
ncbi:MAG: DUF4239 domain-containing protein [Candidatus Colwellbacteria bacterium]|nr:DUF4239 domain-containing protein [Candidatus Colwellbacteria bacterium]